MPVRFFNVSHFAKIYRPSKYMDTMKNMIKFNSADDAELVVNIHIHSIKICQFALKGHYVIFSSKKSSTQRNVPVVYTLQTTPCLRVDIVQFNRSGCQAVCFHCYEPCVMLTKSIKYPSLNLQSV